MKLSSFTDFIFPPVCLMCKSFYHPARQDSLSWKNSQFDIGLDPSVDFSRLMIPFLCPQCSSAFSIVELPVCVRCGFVFDEKNHDKRICRQCFNISGYFRKARSFGIYDRALKKTVHLLKYFGKIQLARPLGILLYSAYVCHWKDQKPDIIIPVPLHKTRFRERGFNQAYLLFKDWPKVSGHFPVKILESRIDKTILVRSRKTLSQVGMDKKQRLANIEGAFSVTDSEKVKGKSFLIIDDVYTTGATAEECAKTLMKNGAKYVDILTLARTLMN